MNIILMNLILMNLIRMNIIRMNIIWMNIILSTVYTLLLLPIYLLVSSAGNLYKQFGPRSGPTKCRAWPGSKLFDILIIFL